MLKEFGSANYFQKARSQPDKVKQVIEKVKTDGVHKTVNTVLEKLDQPLPLGYCNVGTVVEIGEGITNFKVGDRVVSNGKHAEFVLASTGLTIKIPNEVNSQRLSILGSVALQGLRQIPLLAKPW